MPVKVKKIKKGTYIVVEASTGRKTPSSGTFSNAEKAGKQASAINASLREKGKI